MNLQFLREWKYLLAWYLLLIAIFVIFWVPLSQGQVYQAYYERWDGQIRPMSEYTQSNGVYRIQEDTNQYTLTKLDDTLTLPKASWVDYQFGRTKISFTFNFTPSQLGSRSIKDGVNWYIEIPDSIKQLRFVWDNKKPVAISYWLNGTEINGTEISQDNFWMTKQDGKIRFYYNQAARNIGSTSQYIIFQFNTWTVYDNSTSWVGVTTTGAILNPCDGTYEGDLVNSGYIMRYRDCVIDWNRTSANDGTLYNMTWNKSSGGVFNGSAYVNSGNKANLNSTTNISIEVIASATNWNKNAWQDFVSKGGNNLLNYDFRITNTNKLGFSHYNGGWKDIMDTSGVSWTNNTEYDLAVTVNNDNNVSFYRNDTLLSTVLKTHSLVANTQTLNIGRINYYGNYFNGTIKEVRIYSYILNINNSDKHQNQSYQLAVADAGVDKAWTRYYVNGTSGGSNVSWSHWINTSTDNTTWDGWVEFATDDIGTQIVIPQAYRTRYAQFKSYANSTYSPETDIVMSIEIRASDYLQGYVNNSLGAYLENVKVNVGNLSELTDEDGYYSVPLVTDNYSLIAQQIGYGNYTATVSVNGTTWHNFTMVEQTTAPIEDILAYAMIGGAIGTLSIFLIVKNKKDEKQKEDI